MKTARGYVKCSNKECDYKEGKVSAAGAGGAGAENTAAKGGAKNFKPLQSEDFDAPPLMDEPVYGDDQ